MAEKKLKSKKGDNGKYGFVDENGNWVIEPMLDEVNDFTYNEVCKVKSEGKYGVIDKKGNWIIPPQYEEAIIMKDAFDDCLDEEGLFPFEDRIGYVELDGKKGYLKEDGTYQWSPMSPKKDEESGLWGIIDKDGDWYVKPMYEDIWTWHDFMIIKISEELRGREYDRTGIMRTDGRWKYNPYWNVDMKENGEDVLEVWSDGEVEYLMPDGQSVSEDEYEEDEEWDEDED